MPAWAIMNMFRDDDKDEDGDLQRFLENLTIFHLKRQSPLLSALSLYWHARAYQRGGEWTGDNCAN